MKRRVLFAFICLLVGACVDRINLEIPDSYADDFIVDGHITNEPGPYTVKLSRVIKVDDTKPLGIPFYAKSITLYDNVGTSEELELIGDGVYQTKPDGIQGVLGREYHIKIELNDGGVYESIPEKINPVGAIDSIYYDFETIQPLDAPTEYQYRIYADAHDTTGGNHYIRWKLNGTYVVETLPQYTHCLDHDPILGCTWCPASCSGYNWVNGELKEGYAYNPLTHQVEYVIGLHCTCCRCWVTAPETKPKVSDLQLSNGKFNKIEMGVIPVNFYTFFEKYRVQIIQMSLSKNAYEYWKSIESQKEAIGSLFQPVTGNIPTNIVTISGDRGVQGIFYASSIAKKHIYLTKDTHRVEVYVPQDYCQGILRSGAIGMDCRNAFPGSYSTTEKPVDWD